MNPHDGAWFEGFDARVHAVGGSTVMARTGGRTGAAPLLLHGFPQSHVMWHRVARALAGEFALVLPDLRGYGDSARPPTAADHAPYSKRAMADDLVALMQSLGHERFFVCGHDRGGRVAARMALDHPERVAKLCLIDIAPTLDMYAAAGFDFWRLYDHWYFLIQPAPLPEQMIGGCARSFLHAMLGGWGGRGLGHVEPRALAEYERCFCRPEAIHSACEDYRASAGIDLDQDRDSRAAGRRIVCDLLAFLGLSAGPDAHTAGVGTPAARRRSSMQSPRSRPACGQCATHRKGGPGLRRMRPGVRPCGSGRETRFGGGLAQRRARPRRPSGLAVRHEPPLRRCASGGAPRHAIEGKTCSATSNVSPPA